MHESTAAIADAVVAMLAKPLKAASAHEISALATRGRGLLAHGTGRLTVYAIGQRLLGSGPTTTVPRRAHARKKL